MKNDENSTFPRRGFIHGSVAAAAAASFPSGVHAQGKNTDEIRVALVGCGGRGTGAASQAIQAGDRIKLHAMADIDAGQIQRSREILTKAHQDKVNIPPDRQIIGLDAYRRVMSMDEVDAVILTTPPGFRPIHFQAAIEAGKHAFMEKPVAVDGPGVRQVLAAAQVAGQKGLKVGVGLNRRHSPLHEEVVGRLHDGEIGELHTIRLYNCRNGVGHHHTRQPGETELEYQVRNWYYFTWTSGDFIVEQSVHDYDVVRWLKGDANPLQCQGQGGRLVRNGADYGHIYDHFDVEYEFADGSLVATQHRHIPGCWSFFGEKITGTNGTAELAAKARGFIQPRGAEQTRYRESGNSYQIEHDRLFRAIRENLDHNEAERGALSSLMAIMGREAAYTGQMVTWEDALNSEKSIVPTAETWDGEAPILPGEDGRYPVAKPGRLQRG